MKGRFAIVLCTLLCVAGIAAQTLESIPIRVSLAPDAGDSTAIEDRLSPASAGIVDNELDSLIFGTKFVVISAELTAPLSLAESLANF